MADSEEGSDDETDGGDDSIHSATSPMDDFFEHDYVESQMRHPAQEYVYDPTTGHLERRVVGIVTSDSDGEGMSPASSRSRLVTPIATPPPSNLASRLMDMGHIGMFDLEFSEPPEGFSIDRHLEDLDHTDDSHETDSEGELSNMNSEGEDDEANSVDDDDFLADEVPNPPQLPASSEERLQEVWPLGDQSFSIFLCPITHDVMTDPVVSADGYTYERSAIARWFETSRKSPVTGQTLPHIDLVPNHSVRTLLKMLIDMTDVPKKASTTALQSALAPLAANSVRAEAAPSEGGVRRRSSAASEARSDILERATGSASSSVNAVRSPRSDGQAMLENLRAHSAQQRTVDELILDLEALLGNLLEQRASQSLEEEPRLDAQNMTGLSGDVRNRRSLTNLLAAQDSGTSAEASASGSPGRRQARAHTTQVLMGGGDATSSGARPSSQPQAHSQRAAGSSNGQQSSSGGPVATQRSQGPSTALPPLRAGSSQVRSPPQTRGVSPQESGASRGCSSPVVVPPLAYRNAMQGRCLPGSAAFPTASMSPEGSDSRGSSHTSAARHDSDESSSSHAVATGSHRGADKRSIGV
jgi:hypothetical protein